MRFLAFLIIASVILSLAKALTLVLILVFASSLLWALITRPIEFLGFLVFSLLMNALSLSPMTTTFCITGIVALSMIHKSAENAA